MDNCEQKQRSLIMCTTPLQILIAEKIIKLNSNQKFDLLLIVQQNNDKYLHYYKRLSYFCDKSIFYSESYTGLKAFLNYIKIIKDIRKNDSYDYLYLASIDSRNFQYIISRNKLAKIFTFDDGIVNIISDSMYYLNNLPTRKKRFVWRLIGVKYYSDYIRQKSIMHYTIYKDIPNIITNTKFIPLYESNNIKNLQTKSSLRVFLGQPLYEIDEKYDKNYILDYLDKLKIDYYLPHPREKYDIKGNFEIVHTPLIFEDFIVDFIINNPDKQLEIYSFISGALLNVASFQDVTLKFIYDESLYTLHKNFYDLAYNSFKIPYYKIEKD